MIHPPCRPPPPEDTVAQSTAGIGPGVAAPVPKRASDVGRPRPPHARCPFEEGDGDPESFPPSTAQLYLRGGGRQGGWIIAPLFLPDAPLSPTM